MKKAPTVESGGYGGLSDADVEDQPSIQIDLFLLFPTNGKSEKICVY